MQKTDIFTHFSQFSGFCISEQIPFKGPDNKYHYIYLTINLVNNKFYIGKRTEPRLSKYLGSGQKFKTALKKYGKENFLKFYIEFNSDIFKNEDRERGYITEQMCKSDLCYNMIPGKLQSGLLGELHPSKISAKNGTHHFLGKTNPTFERLEKGTHNFQGENHPAKIASKLGTHWMNGLNSPVHKQIAEGKNKFFISNPNQNIPPWQCSGSTDKSKQVWLVADLIYNILLKNPKAKRDMLRTLYKRTYGIELPLTPLQNVREKILTGWNPSKDEEWLSFKTNYIKGI